MKKILNSADTFVRDTMEGIEAAYGDRVELLGGDFRVLVSTHPKKEGKVGIHPRCEASTRVSATVCSPNAWPPNGDARRWASRPS